MAKAFLPLAEKYTKRHGRRKRWQKIVSAMACVVVFCTAYALILPAITMEQTAYCGIQAHTHGDSCYEQQLICGDSDTPQAAQPAHTHGENCYEEQETLICGQKESEEHSHTQACYQKKQVLTCTRSTAESQPKQTHTHTDACYEKKMVCDQEEHKHSLACYSDPEADVERKTVWERSMKDVKLTDVWADDVIAIAESQIGYTESEKNYIVQADGRTTQGYTRYGAWYGEPYGDWCAMFVSFCLHYADIPKSAVPYEASCAKWVKTLSKKTWDLYHSAKEYTPQKGDLIFLDTDGDRTADHVGLVAQVDETEKTLQVIEGNSKDKVRSVTYRQKDSQILGYGALPAQEDCDPADEEKPTAEAQPTELDTSEPEPDASEPEPDTSEPDTSEPNQDEDEDGNGNNPVPQAPLTEDSAYVSSLSLQDVAVLSDADTSAYQEQTVHNQDALSYPFTAKLAAYGEEDTFDSARLKVEAVLPLDEEKAAFDLDAMPWLEQDKAHAPKVKTEKREIDGETVSCQVLTGYTLSQSAEGDNVVPGRVAQSVVVALTDAQPGDTVSLQLSAATEYSAWEDTCATHNLVEKRTVTADPYTVVAALTEEELEANYQRFLKEVEQLEATEDWDAASDLLTRLEEAYELEQLTEEAYTELTQRVQALLEQGNQAVAEPSHGDNWKKLRDSGWFEEYSATSTKDVLSRKAVRAALAGDTSPSSQQIDEPGGSKTQDDVTVSKTIQGTDLENVFDITLQVQTPQNIQKNIDEPDMAVVIVMDISNTMTSKFGNSTRYQAAMEAAEDFLDRFVENNSLGISKIGYVAFNTDAHKIFDLQPCTDVATATTLKNTMRTQTGKIINVDGYASAHNRFTNVEAGLKMGADMLAQVNNKNKFIVFLSDGFPTTYLPDGATDYKGYDPYNESASTERFYDHVLDVPCSSGTSYSNEAAIRARKEAAKIKTAGTKIFSIGVDVGGQTIQKYVEQSENLGYMSVVDRENTNYEIGDASSTDSYKTWLRDSIGSGYYYDSTNTTELKDAYTQIFDQIKTQIETATQADWVATDPIPMISENVRMVEFIGLYDKTPALQGDSLEGKNEEGAENTASYSESQYAISWDLKKSGYTTSKDGNTTIYTYTIKYRVRLMNETDGFVENQVYNTNGTTKLQYRIVQTKNGTTTISDSKTIEFPIPSVHGYLGELTFTKQDNRGNNLADAEFTLSHDTDTCTICRGNNTAVTTVESQTATSDVDGKVSFTGIPSGHTYTLEETKIPDGYQKTGEHYRVIVAYDKVTVQVEKGGEWSAAEDWKGIITNYTGYQLPDTGGAGTILYTAGGLLLMTAAGLFLLYQYRMRRRGE